MTDLENVFRVYELAKQGDAKAQDTLGDCYYNGEGVEQDYMEAVKWYRKAANQGNSNAQDMLGDCYYNGYGVEQDYVEAVKWYRKAADQGNSNAQDMLGDCYYNGYGVEQDYVEAVKWYRKAADQGNSGAQATLGYCYYNGEGVEQDYMEAVKWYRKAADQGNSDAQAMLGYCYLYGLGVEENINEAVKRFRKLADQGDDSLASLVATLEEIIKCKEPILGVLCPDFFGKKVVTKKNNDRIYLRGRCNDNGYVLMVRGFNLPSQYTLSYSIIKNECVDPVCWGEKGVNVNWGEWIGKNTVELNISNIFDDFCYDLKIKIYVKDIPGCEVTLEFDIETVSSESFSENLSRMLEIGNGLMGWESN